MKDRNNVSVFQKKTKNNVRAFISPALSPRPLHLYLFSVTGNKLELNFITVSV